MDPDGVSADWPEQLPKQSRKHFWALCVCVCVCSWFVGGCFVCKFLISLFAAYENLLWFEALMLTCVRIFRGSPRVRSNFFVFMFEAYISMQQFRNSADVR